MRLLQLIFLFVLLSGCKSATGPCETDLSQLMKVAELPENLESKYKDDTKGWYKYESGDFFYCKSLESESVCGNVFELSFLQKDGSYKTEEILCMR
ncbi:hypothetical protein ACFO4O_15650 [Glaciecola siphonariae]|uniref:Lipoprotein n=1 Tax=Glaciecola siphonariae TaxID=521012 RepID=A0ABV9M0Z7_9ALTE